MFQIRNGKYSPDYVSVMLIDGRGQIAQTIPWKTWSEQTGASILGVQPLNAILGNALNYPDKYADFDIYNTLVYVSKDGEYDMNKVMMTKLYLGDYLDDYRAAGLASGSIEKSKYFTLVDGFLGDRQDNSYYGFVELYKVNYP